MTFEIQNRHGLIHMQAITLKFYQDSEETLGGYSYNYEGFRPSFFRGLFEGETFHLSILRPP
jgi:hypothetical protein